MRHIFLVMFVVCFCGCRPSRSEIDKHLASRTLEELRTYESSRWYAKHRRNELYWQKAKQAYSFDFALGDLVQSKIGGYQGMVMARDVRVPTNSYGTPPPAKPREFYCVKFPARGQTQHGQLLASANSKPALFSWEWVGRYEITRTPNQSNKGINP